MKRITLCDVTEAPAPGNVVELEADGFSVCLANIGGELSALDNWCPHRRGPLGQGWIEGHAVICPWHSWAFDATTGLADFPENERVAVYPIHIEGDRILVDVDQVAATGDSLSSEASEEK